MKSKLQ